MVKEIISRLSRRERQIMDIIYRKGTASAAEIQKNLPSAPGYSAVRALLRVLEDKGYLKHKKDGQRYLFYPVIRKSTVRKSALSHVVSTFFDGSIEQAVSTLLDVSKDELTEDQLDRMMRAIEKARMEGR